jgi:hypothetical protein
MVANTAKNLKNSRPEGIVKPTVKKYDTSAVKAEIMV